ncbi:hypothetical protein E4T50_06035 [Aureobasidium sp. EXF-12298]|nr:hypothetical protein E4T50_06035 [Aureobasidium sp. EXF-12298]
MKSDCLARRAILFVTFIITTTILYGISTRFLFTAPNYDDVSIDPEGGSYYDYGSKVATAVWRGAGHWIGMTESGSTNTTVILAVSSVDAIDESQDQGLDPDLTEHDTLDPATTYQEDCGLAVDTRNQIIIDIGHPHTTHVIARSNTFPDNTAIVSVLQYHTDFRSNASSRNPTPTYLDHNGRYPRLHAHLCSFA